jgi:phosphoglycolate phosphatase
MIRPKTHNVLFDLDGTLVDSSGAIQASLTHALGRLGRGWPEGLDVRRVIGMPLVDIFREHFAVVDEPAERAIAAYRDHYDAEARSLTRVYDHVQATLESLSGGGTRLYLATVKPTPIAAKVLEEMGLARWFSGVAGSSMDHSRRDKGDIIHHAVDRHGLDPDASVMVGDRAQDMVGARRNGMWSVGVTYGFGSEEELTAAGADRLIRCCSELPGALRPART